MPKTSNEGPSYAGLTDVSAPETLVPEWVEPTADADNVAEDVAAEPVDVSRETKTAEDKPAAHKSAKRGKS